MAKRNPTKLFMAGLLFVASVFGVVAQPGVEVVTASTGGGSARWTTVHAEFDSLPDNYVGSFMKSNLVVPTGTDVTVKLRAEYTDTVASPTVIENVAIPETTPMHWEYCVSNCGSHSSPVFETLGYTLGTTLELADVSDSMRIRATPLETGFVVGDSSTPSIRELWIAVVDDPSAIKMYASWHTVGVPATDYVLRPLMSDNPDVVGAMENAIFSTVIGSHTTYSLDGLGNRTDMGGLLTINPSEDYVVAFEPSDGSTPGIDPSESVVINTDNAALETSVAKPSIDTARTYAKPTISTAMIDPEQIPTTPAPSVVLVDAQNGETLLDVKNESIANVTLTDKDVKLVDGWSFKINGAVAGTPVKVKLALSELYENVSVLRAYKSKAGNVSQIDGAVFSNENGKTYLSYDLVDGGALDEDGVVNGTIVDPVYVGVNTATLAATGISVPQVAALALITMVGGAILATRRIVTNK